MPRPDGCVLAVDDAEVRRRAPSRSPGSLVSTARRPGAPKTSATKRMRKARLPSRGQRRRRVHLDDDVVPGVVRVVRERLALGVREVDDRAELRAAGGQRRADDEGRVDASRARSRRRATARRSAGCRSASRSCGRSDDVRDRRRPCRRPASRRRCRQPLRPGVPTSPGPARRAAGTSVRRPTSHRRSSGRAGAGAPGSPGCRAGRARASRRCLPGSRSP